MIISASFINKLLLARTNKVVGSIWQLMIKNQFKSKIKGLLITSVIKVCFFNGIPKILNLRIISSY